MGKSSTGPRTPKGKARSSRNAAKHWIESGRILPSEEEEAGSLRQRFTEDFNPSGLAENEVIDDLVFNRLIKRRVDVAFTREFSKASAIKPLIQLENHEDSAVQFYLRSGFSRGTDPGKYGARLRPDLCLAGLETLRNEITAHGLEPDHDLRVLRSLYGGELTEHAAMLMNRLTEIVGGTDTRAEEELKESVLEGLQAEIELQKQRRDVAAGILAVEVASDIQEPAGPALETLLRYRSANTREFKDLLDSLERIRRLRRAES
jgi:hypothetical protein